MPRILLACTCLFVWFPSVSEAVSISEVAWMGDAVSANNEWIELYNPGPAVPVDGWRLSDGMNLTIALAGTIPANSYVLLERNRASGAYLTVPPFVIYTGALVNTGATLTLMRADGGIEDQVAGGEGWVTIGGDNVTKETAQYTSAGWRTGTPTPGRQNISATTPPLTSPVTTATTTPSVTTPTTTTPATPVSSSKPISPKSSGNSQRSETVKLEIPNVSLRLALDMQSTAYVNQPVVIRVTPSGLGPSWLASLKYEWNFGDMSTSSLLAPIHRYAHPGTYMVTVRASYGRHEQVAMGQVTVLPVPITLAYTEGGIQLQNNAPYEVDVSHYRLSAGAATAWFPPRTIVAAKSTITVPLLRLKTTYGTPLTLRDRAGEVVSLWPSLVSPVTEMPPPSRPAATVVQAEPSALAPVAVIQEVQATETSSMPPLVLLPEEETSLMPAYVRAALTPRADNTAAVSTSGQSIPWTYGALVLLILGAVIVVLATSQKMSRTQSEIITFR